MNLIIVMDLIIHNFELHSIVYAMSSLVVHIIIIMQLALKWSMLKCIELYMQ